MNVVLEPWVIIREKKVYHSLNKEANIRSLVTTIRRGDSSKSEPREVIFLHKKHRQVELEFSRVGICMNNHHNNRVENNTAKPCKKPGCSLPQSGVGSKRVR